MSSDIDHFNALIPGKNCFVKHRDAEKHSGELGVVLQADTVRKRLLVKWGGRDASKEWHQASELGNGFRAGHIVQDRPRSNVRKTLGCGTVLNHREIAGREMVLVQLHGTGESRWLPFQQLIRVRDAGLKYRNQQQQSEDPQRFRLKVLAYALQSWNQITGALDRLDVDPLPHQIDLVHRIMTSDHSNWLIADDVGLGKTIEVGLLLAAMKRRHRSRRVLVVCPAGMVRQWQDEMLVKFSEDFRIYGVDFSVHQPAHWVSFDKVIVSLDRAKSERHRSIFGDSGFWDVIVFDEAHHLSKIEGAAVTQRYRLAERLKDLTDSFIFLTGTPHQGKTEQFVNLLALLRPDLKAKFAQMFADPSIVAEVVVRNRKSKVTDASGKLLFFGQDTHLVEAPISSEAREFDHHLRRYLRHGYAASEEGGVAGRAVGFVMTTYRKLASSSIAAIERALKRRRAKVNGDSRESAGSIGITDFEELEDTLKEGEDGRDDLDDVLDGVAVLGKGANPFFVDEVRLLNELCVRAKIVSDNDLKLKTFLEDIVEALYREGKKLLVFTEYRATQEYLVAALEDRYPSSVICQIHGGMNLSEKRRNIDSFNDLACFMVSTEAGGEGINLHYNCHVLVNYDLPWNPRRLVQRAGRLYRYGQRERVIAFNLMSQDSFDNRALGMLLDRVSTIARDMAEVSHEFDEGLQNEVVGELLERVDMAHILASNREMEIERSESDIADAIKRAEQSRTLQDKLFSHIEGYDPETTPVLHSFGPVEVLAFLEGILPLRGIRIRKRLYNGRLLEIELPEEMRGKHSEFADRLVARITVDRRLVLRDQRNVSMDFASAFFAELIEFATSPEFGGEFASIRGPIDGVLGVYRIRWQNDQGVPRWETLLPAFLANKEDFAGVNPAFFGSLLLESDSALKKSESTKRVNEDRDGILGQLRKYADRELSTKCTALRHPNDVVLLAAADVRKS